MLLSRPILALALGVLAAPVGALFGLSMGFHGIGTAWAVAAAGTLAHPHRAAGLAGLLAAILPFLLMLAMLQARWPPGAAVLLVVFLPALAWVAFAAVAALRKD